MAKSLPPNELVKEHEAWRARMAAITKRLKDNPHRQERDHGTDGHFRNGVFIQGVSKEELDAAFSRKRIP